MSKEWRSFVVKPKSVCWAETRCWRMLLSHNHWGMILLCSQTTSMGGSSPNSANQADFRKPWWQKFLKLFDSPAQPSAAIKSAELFLHWPKCLLIYWIYTSQIGWHGHASKDHVCLGELKTGAHASERFPYLNKKWYKTSTALLKIFLKP